MIYKKNMLLNKLEAYFVLEIIKFVVISTDEKDDFPLISLSLLTKSEN